MESLDIAKGMSGLHLIGRFMTEPEKNISAIPFVLSGHMDNELYQGFYLSEYGTKRDFEENDPKIKNAVEGLKNLLRQFVQEIFRRAAEEDRMEQIRQLERVKAELAQSSKPSEYGTVAEIAQKFGISKSEVRRRKAEGTLGELFKK